MTFEEYKKAFSIAASNSGYSEENIIYCLQYAENLFRNNVPVIYNTSHLAALVGYNKKFIKRSVIYNKYYYRDFKISKKNGEKRLISEPLPSLKEIQTWILNSILYNVKINPFAKAYRRNISILENIRFHKQQPKVLTIDIENFFTSINTISIEKIFLDLGYSKLISNLLAKICTKEDCLPQGAPTSPYLSNIFFKNTDDKIVNYCLENKIKYTRYADDLTFSGNFDELCLIEFIKNVVEAIGLKINIRKTKLMLPNSRQIVTGIVVNNKLQVPKYKRNKIRQEMYYIMKYGLNEHIKLKKINQNNYLEHLLGKVSFITQINPLDEEFQKYKSHLINLKNFNKNV